jgi:hypothetical protein
LKNIKTVLPNVKHLYVVAGSARMTGIHGAGQTISGTGERSLCRVTYLTGLGTTELVHVLSAAPKDSAVMMLTYVANSQGQP